MLKSLQFWILSTAGAACLLLAAANIVLLTGNRTLQGQVSQRGQYIQQSTQVQALYRQIVQAVADLSVRNQDAQLQAILARQGLHVTARPQSPAAAPAPAAAPPQQTQRRQGAHHHE